MPASLLEKVVNERARKERLHLFVQTERAAVLYSLIAGELRRVKESQEGKRGRMRRHPLVWVKSLNLSR